MELIYVWVEKYRNIEQCGFHLSKNFIVEVIPEGREAIENGFIDIKRVNVKRNEENLDIWNKKNINIYGNNISNVSAVVGKNSVGKSNFLGCIGELLTSFDNSSFILIYYNKDKDSYIVECNQIAIKDSVGNIKYAIHRRYQPTTLILAFNNGKITKTFEHNSALYDVEYITIKESMNEMMRPDANYFYSYIPRVGLSYKEAGVFYQFKYLKDPDNIENYKNNDVFINFEVANEWGMWEEYEMKFFLEQYYNERSYYDTDYNDKRLLYKNVFMLRFFECILNAMRITKDVSIIKQNKELKELISNCRGDIDKLLQNYQIIKEKTIEIRTILMENNIANKIDIEVCYKKFIELLEKIIMKTDEQNFMNSYKFTINISLMLQDNEFCKCMYDFLELADSNDICLEFLSTSIKVYYSNLSDGLKERFNLFSTIYKCFKQNPVEKFQNIILILDEPDVHMHPEWSRSLFTEILDFLKKEFCESKFQIIFTTHSPFMLSDMPKEDVIYLNKDDSGKLYVDNAEINTFGSNIHMLLKHSFFMDSTIGAFANQKIKEVAKDLSRDINEVSENRKEEIRYIIDNIGEPVIKRKLEDMYSEKFEQTEINNKIEELSKKIKKLEKIIKEKGLE